MEHNKANLTPLSILKYLSTEVTMAEGDWNLGTKIWLIKSPKQSLGDLLFLLHFLLLLLLLLLLFSFSFLSVDHELVHGRSQELLDRISWNVVEL